MNTVLRSLQLCVLLVLTAAVLGGCRLQREYPPQWVRKVGTGYNPGVAFQLIPPELPGGEWKVADPGVSGTVMAHGDGQAPPGAMDPLQGKLIARQRARQDARRKLARKVEATELHPGVTVASILENNSARKNEVEAFIRSAVQKGVVDDAAGSCTVFMSLDLSPLNEILRDSHVIAFDPGSSTSVTTLTPEEASARMRQEAIDSARAQLLEYIKGLALPEGGTVGDRMLLDDRVDRAIRREIEQLQPAIAFKPDNTCEAALLMDIAEVQRILEERKGSLARMGVGWPKMPKWLAHPENY